jgi:4-hydroxythreonine-4-phosphate dehydrogenase
LGGETSLPYPVPRIAITIGDPAGIGPEVVLKALAHENWQSQCQITLVGNASVLRSCYQSLRHWGNVADPDQWEILELPCASFTLGAAQASSGAASFHFLQTAILETLAGRFDGIVTAPISKTAWYQAGHCYPGQTELLAQLSGSERYGMMFHARSPYTNWAFRVLLATTHIPLRQVPDVLDSQLVRQKLDLFLEVLQQDFKESEAQIAVAGLNPHAGEAGALGTEEVEWLAPLLAQYPQVRGPIPPDTLWVQPGQLWHDPDTRAKRYAGYLALYHDQGLIPVKLLAFDRAVNVSIGLPFVRTSPDHGTAFDIAGQGIADAKSMIHAIELAIELMHNRAQRAQPVSTKP